MNFASGNQHSPHFSTNVVNAVNFQVNFRNLHHSLQGLKLSCLQLIFEEDVLYGSRRTGFLHVLVDKFLIKCVTHEGFVEKVNSVSSWIVFHSFHFLCIFQVVLGYSLDASPELVNQAYIVNAHVLEISPRGRSFSPDLSKLF